MSYQELWDKFPELQPVLSYVGELDLKTLRKDPYPALIGVIVGQKIRYSEAKKIRSYIYSILGGTSFTKEDVMRNKNKLSHLDKWNTIEILNEYLDKQDKDYLDYSNSNLVYNIEKLADEIEGIGKWTVQSTLLVCMPEDCDIFPSGDKFLQNVLVKIGLLTKCKKESDVKRVTEKYKGYRGIITWYMWRYFE